MLCDEEAASTSTEIHKQPKISSKSQCFDSFVVMTSKYDYPRLGKVPAIKYLSTIADMKVRKKNDKKILDVFYDLQDNYGRLFYILQSYPEGSQPFKRLSTALAAAGVPKGATVDAGIGITELITIDYRSKDSEFGSIVAREPYPVTPDDSDQDDEEFDADILEDEED